MTHAREAAGTASVVPDHLRIVTEQVDGVPMRVFQGPPRTLADVLAASRAGGDADYLVYRGDRMSFREHHATVAALAARMCDLGLAPGARVAVAMRNFPEFAVTFWACQALGLITVPLNAWWTGPELRYALEHSGACLLVGDVDRIERLRAAGWDQGAVPVVVVRADRELPATLAWADLVDPSGAPAEPPEVGVQPGWPSTILYTSGTTGRPRGAVHTHRNHVTNLLATELEAVTQGGGLLGRADQAQPVMLATMPLFHISQLSSLYLAAYNRQRLVLMYKWDPAVAAELIEAEQVTSVVGVPMQIAGLLDELSASGRRASSLTAVGMGATTIPPHLVNRVRDQLGPAVTPLTGYGMTETTSSVSTIAGDDYLAHPGSVGPPRPLAEVKVVSDGGEVPVGAVGELWIAGPHVISGYWNDPEATAAAFVDGWHRTGDLVRRDHDGRIYVVDRLKDVVIRGGENVYCAEVEAAIHAHPSVRTAVVLGLPHPVLGEEVAAVVRTTPGASLTVEELTTQLRRELADFKVPSVIVFTDTDVPRTATGKALKRELRSLLMSEGAYTGTPSTNETTDDKGN